MNDKITGASVLRRIKPVLHAPAYLAGCVRALEDWRRRERLSMQLAHVDAHTLRDAGISEAQRFIGVHHPFD